MTDKRSSLLGTFYMTRSALHRDRALPRTRPVARGARPLAGAVQKAAAPVYKAGGRIGGGTTKGTSATDLTRVWPDIVGDTLAHMTRPEHYQPGRGAADNGVLTVRVAGAFGLDLQHLSPQIIERVNAHFGYRAVAKIKVIQGPIPKADAPLSGRSAELSDGDRSLLEAAVAPVSEPGLKNALTRLGAKILQRRE